MSTENGDLAVCYHCDSALLDPDYCPHCHRHQYVDCPQCRFHFHKQYTRCPKCNTPRPRSSHRRHSHRKTDRLSALIPNLHAPAWLPLNWITLGLYRRCWRCRNWQPYLNFIINGKEKRLSGTCKKCRIVRPPSIDSPSKP